MILLPILVNAHCAAHNTAVAGCQVCGTEMGGVGVTDVLFRKKQTNKEVLDILLKTAVIKPLILTKHSSRRSH